MFFVPASFSAVVVSGASVAVSSAGLLSAAVSCFSSVVSMFPAFVSSFSPPLSSAFAGISCFPVVGLAVSFFSSAVSVVGCASVAFGVFRLSVFLFLPICVRSIFPSGLYCCFVCVAGVAASFVFSMSSDGFFSFCLWKSLSACVRTAASVLNSFFSPSYCSSVSLRLGLSAPSIPYFFLRKSVAVWIPTFNSLIALFNLMLIYLFYVFLGDFVFLVESLISQIRLSAHSAHGPPFLLQGQLSRSACLAVR